MTTLLLCGGIFNDYFIANFLLSLTVKNFENRSIFREVTGKSLVSCFFGSRCRDQQKTSNTDDELVSLERVSSVR